MKHLALRALATLILVICGCGRAPAATVPDELTGSWTTITAAGNGFSYEISGRGVYVFVGIMQSDTQQYTKQENGTFTVRGSEITFSPATVTITRTDSARPAENYRSAAPAAPRTENWSVSGDELTLEQTLYQRS